MLLEFAILESTIVRIQMLRRSNAMERERYAQSKVKILETAQDMRENIVELKVQLQEAQKTRDLRKEYDALTEKIYSNRMLRSRDDQRVQLDKLTSEIEDLKEEAEEHKRTWTERKEHFVRIVEEGKRMVELIKGVKDEPENKDEDMDVDEAEGEGTKAMPSNINSPMPVEDAPEGALLTATTSLQVPSQSRLGSRAASPSKVDQDKDMEMGEVPASPAPSNLSSEMEEGEAEDDDMEGVEGT